MRAGRRIDAGLVLLDRKVTDANGLMACNVDDLNLTSPSDGAPPYVSAILAGPAALAPRLGGRFGAWVESVHNRLHPSERAGPAGISFAVVKRVGVAIELSVPREDLQITLFEDWVRQTIIAKIPGAHRASD